MNSESIKLIAQLFSTLVAITALIVSFRTERRNQRRFERQLELTTKIATANIKPMLAVSVDGYIDNKGVTLSNYGPGTAVITSLGFSKGKQRSQDMSELIEFDTDQDVIWDECPSFDDKPYYIPSKSSEDLLRLTLERLIEDGFSEDEAVSLLEVLEQQIDEIKIIVTYEDVLGNKIAEKERLR
jgi:hypothetical protein